MRAGQRLAREAKLVSRHSDGRPVQRSEGEVVGGYWFILAGSLEGGREIAAQNPCLACGLVSTRTRPLEHERASAFKLSSETPRE
jgi:hypothetical protein